MRKLQIGIIGSMADTELESNVKQLAAEIGSQVAKNDAILMFGYEGDFSSISLLAAQAAEQAGGLTVAYVWDGKKKDLMDLNSLQVVTGQNRGGGREFAFIRSCDAVISLSGGSGTLMEMTMAYQADVPIVALKNTGGWSDKLAGQFLDHRQRNAVLSATSAEEAVEMALKASSVIKENL